MLHVLFILLKILGFFLLFLLALLLLLLITPVRYQFQMEKEQDQALEGKGRVTWLFAVISFAAGYIGQTLEYQVRIFGLQVLGNQPAFLEKKEEKRKRKSEKRKRKEEKDKSKKKESKDESEQGEKEPELAAMSVGTEESGRADQTGTGEPTEQPEEAYRKPRPKETKKKKRNRADDNKPKEKASGKLSSLLSQVKEWKTFFDEIQGRELIQIAWDTVIRVLKHVLPRKIRGYLRFGFDDPAATGYITAAAAAAYPVYGRNFTLEPDFQESCFQTRCSGRGRIRPGFFLYILIRLLLKKSIRNLIKKLLNR